MECTDPFENPTSSPSSSRRKSRTDNAILPVTCTISFIKPLKTGHPKLHWISGVGLIVQPSYFGRRGVGVLQTITNLSHLALRNRFAQPPLFVLKQVISVRGRLRTRRKVGGSESLAPNPLPLSQERGVCTQRIDASRIENVLLGCRFDTRRRTCLVHVAEMMKLYGSSNDVTRNNELPQHRFSTL
ncbi:hypothetical protein CDAR_95181 [Caerostris darwini]|uniref:Uncharacterized protein n=1 Tax=Caerostris darwini TaxID=1538125 RepID=A0AAV4PHU0_9ARAC|nr:hypothetical protein CDAR_95181 [Caerostris darwini]